MSESLQPISRTVDNMTVTLSTSGLDIWFETPATTVTPGWRFPISRRLWESYQVQFAIKDMLAEAAERAHIQNTARELLGPIDGPDGEA